MTADVKRIFSKKLRSGTQHSMRRRAQVLLEMALVTPVLLVLLMLVVQYGILMSTTVSLTNLSREGARFAVSDSTPSDETKDREIKDRIEAVLPSTIKWDDIKDNITITPPEDSGQRIYPNIVEVRISYDMRKKLFLPSNFFGIQLFSRAYTATAVMTFENGLS